MNEAQPAMFPALTGSVRDAPRGRELQIVGEIAHAVLHAARPVEVYRLALDRVTPLLQAQFSSVFLRDAVEPTLLKLECAHNWPQATARYLGQMRIREGRGPTGRAVAEMRAIEVENIFEDPALREWWEPARELGFTSLISLPLVVDGAAVGALTFYFDQGRRFSEGDRRLLTLIADQLATMASRAQLVEELRAANQKLHERNDELSRRLSQSDELRRLKDEFVANVSHELRTPLTSIRGYTELLRDGELGPLGERQAAAITRIDAAGQALLRLITDLLDLMQLKLGRVPLNAARHDAARLARAAADRAATPTDAVRFELVQPDPVVTIVTDGDKVVRILMNLISNAFKFTPRGAVEVSVTTDPEGGVVWLVSDTGIGIAERDRDAIFDEFRQVDGSTTRLYGGTGLGLALSRSLAALLGGGLTVESRLGEGSTFRLRLPGRPAG
jgi:signal transduction histidine kinase